MADEQDDQTPFPPQGDGSPDSVPDSENASSGGGSDSDPRPEGRSRQEEAAVIRERVRFMRWLGLGDDEAIALFHRMRLAGLNGDRALTGATAMERVLKLRSELDARLRRIPRFAFPEFRSRYRLGQRVKANSELMQNLGDDADELARMLILSSEMIVRLAGKMDEQMDLHEALSARMDALRSVEEKAVESIPAWLIDVVRVVESMGFDRAQFRSKGRAVAEGFRAVLEQHADPDLAAPEVADRMVERLASSIDGSAPDDDDQGVDEQDDFVFPMGVTDTPEEPAEVTATPVEAVPSPASTPMASVPEERSEDMEKGVSEPPREKPPVPMIGEFDAFSIPATTSRLTTTDRVRVHGFAMVDGIDSDELYAGLMTQFERGDPSPADASLQARLELRQATDMASLRLVDGMLPDAAWMHYEVPFGDYMMVQMKGMSARLPRYRPGSMMPPFASMSRYGEMVGSNDRDLKSLGAWDAPGQGPDHMRTSQLDSGRGDPELAAQVMRRAVQMHLSGTLPPDEMARVTPAMVENMARFWLFLVVGRMRHGQLELLWPGGFFHGVEGHDPGLSNEGHMRIYRRLAGSVEHALRQD